MTSFSTLTVALFTTVSTPPPGLAVPSFGDAWAGWLMGLVAFLAPNALLAWRSHTWLGHWARFLAQWRHRSWWAVVIGSTSLAIGTFFLLGALPAWENHWRLWTNAANANGQPDAQVLAWMDQLHEQDLQIIQIGSLAALIGGAVILIIGAVYYMRRVLVRRKAVTPTSDWMMAPPLTR